jgi:hypothetical protein
MADVGPDPDRKMLTFVLPFALDSLNVRDRKHRYAHGHDKKQMALEVLAAIGGSRYKPFPPWPRVRVTIVRCSSGKLDRDNLWGSAKNLCDVLCAQSPRHPSGLSICLDDTEAAMDLKVSQSSAPPGKGSTVVRVEPIE